MHNRSTLALLLPALLLASPALAGKKKDKPAEAPPAAAPAAEAPAAAPAAVEPGIQAIYDYRHEVYESLGKHMKALSMIVKGQVEARPKDMVAHATALNQVSLIIPDLFPDGTGPDVVPDTEALSTIWTDRAGFDAAAATFQTESAALVQVAGSGDLDAFKAQFGKVGQSCGGCHDGYRKDDGH